MSNLFNSVKGLKPKRNAFSAHSYRNDYTCNLGQLVPIYIQHTVPGTTIHVSTSALIRLQALISPIMDNIDYYVHFWQIPYRLLEDGRFTKFVGGEMEDADYNPAYITGKALAHELTGYSALYSNGSLLDMLGYDEQFFTTLSEIKVNIRPIQAYAFLLLHWYINEHVMPYPDFQDDVEDLLSAEGASHDAVATFLIKLNTAMGLFFNHGWSKDYFTSALPNVQEGSPVTLSMAGTAPIPVQSAKLGAGFKFEATPDADVPLNTGSTEFETHLTNMYSIDDASEPVFLSAIQGNLSDPEGDPLQVDLSEATAITINELRVANALQVFKERIMRFGHRAPEYYKGFFNVTPEDLRLQLPKYLGGGRIPINIADVEQTSSSDSTSPQGNLAGKATAIAGGFAGFTTFTSEESIIIGVAWLQPKVTYSNSISRFLLKLNDRYDYFNPSFEHLGEQEIQNVEVWSGGNQKEFGYTPRFAEYRFHQNEQHGNFKGNMAHWTLGRLFTSQPTLSPEFVYMQPSVLQRIFAVVEDSSHNPIPNVLASVKFNVRIVAPISRYGTPMLLA